MHEREPLAQQVEHRPFKPGVLGSSPRRLTFLSHTADIGFIVQADIPEEIVIGAIYGLFAAILGEDYLRKVFLEGKKERRLFTIKSQDLSLALHNLLEDLLYQFDTRRWVPIEVESIFVFPDKYQIDASIWFRQLSRKYRGEVNEVKAVTYHNLRFEKKGDVWEAEVILDV